MSSTNANVDRLSLLPDVLLAHILSSMPTKSAVGTSILSKRWKSCWTLVHSFDFHYIDHIPNSDTFLSFVDRVLKLCKTSQVKLFRLHCSESLIGNTNVPKWINEAVKLNVCELDIQVIIRELPLSLFTCKTLTTLRLAIGGCDSDVLNVPTIPSGVTLPCLKTLDIRVFNEPFVNVCKLIYACPILESLSLSLEKRRWREDNQEYSFNIPTLKRFELRTPRCTSSISKVVLNVPNVEYLILGGFLSSVFLMEDLMSLVEATVRILKSNISIW
ncbi:F-box/LRR-repeat protein At3g59200-like [Lactuca sativa]|uniref:F-box/LRR-repeat protein At3g59200-like n=1 Tax=Lactuca sativa TaxID=4236 RepID=UPI000CD9CCCC|nr:F-box/LRR-repeat protein At3g59200-like [Lactuca sativa]